MPQKEEAIQHASKYFERRAIDSAELSAALPELLKVIEDLYPLRNSVNETRKYIEIWRKTKFKQSFNHTLETGEVVEVFNNDPDMSVHDRFVNWLFFYLHKQYEEKTDKTIGYAFALEILTQIYNCQKGNLITYELPNTNLDDVLDIIEVENVKPVRKKLKELDIATLENLSPSLNSAMMGWQNTLTTINASYNKIQKLQKATQPSFQQSTLIEKLNLQYVDKLRQEKEAAQYTPEEVFQMRLNNDSIIYKTPNDVLNSYGNVWENGKYGCFVQYDGNPFGLNSIFQKSDGKGLRFYQLNKDGNSIFSFQQNKSIVISGFGEYVIINWGKDLNKLIDDYTSSRNKVLTEKWRRDNFPTKVNQLVRLDIFNIFKENEITKWNESTISDFLSAKDFENLKFCFEEFLTSLDKCIQYEKERGEISYVDSIKSHTLKFGYGWANGKSGQFRVFDNNYQLRFCETDENGYHFMLKEEEQMKLPVLACGFVAWLIKHWGTDTQTIYSGYLQARLNKYKSEHSKDADVFKRDLEQEFYNHYTANEEQWVLQSEAIFDFISEAETNKIKEYVQYFFEYVENLTQPLKIDDYTKESEIIKCTLPNIKQIYTVLKKYPVESSTFSPLAMINDLRRIKQYHEFKPDECIAFIADKYKMRWAESTRFIECLKLIIDEQSDFMFLLMNQSFMILLLKNVQNDFAKNFNIPLTVNSNLSNTNEPEQSNLDTESLKEDSVNLKFNGNEALIAKIHEHCNNDIFICNDTDFVNCVLNANFSLLQIKTKSKVKLLIYYLSKQMGAIWYEQTAKSLGYKKSDCSGANVTDSKWKKQIQRIIPQ